MIAENWRPIAGYEGRYEVSDQGRVRSLERYVSAPTFGTSGMRTVPERILKTDAHARDRHLRVHLYGDRGSRRFFVHHLVLEAFVESRPDGMEACHNNGDPNDNRLVNLRWDTRSANVRDAIRHGTRGGKTHCPQGHPYAGENLGIEQRGSRYCRACKRAMYSRWRRKKRLQPLATEAAS